MKGYNQIDQHIHQLSQIIAKANRTFVPKQADDSHTNLFFDPIGHRIYGRWIKTKNQNIILALNLQFNKFEWLSSSITKLHSIEIEGYNYDQLEELVEKSFSELGMNKDGFRNELHFEITAYDFVSEPYKSFDYVQLLEWENYRWIANEACAALLGHLQIESEVRIWPHHFDTGIYVEPNKQIGLGFGLAMEDSMVKKPYFYFTGNGLHGHAVDYKAAPKLTHGYWIIDQYWKGAVLPIPLSHDNFKLIHIFLNEVGSWFLKNMPTEPN